MVVQEAILRTRRGVINGVSQVLQGEMHQMEGKRYEYSQAQLRVVEQ